mmetsp:Transcript_106635/g.340265  ORF Transcript_106635/g.340265 Transcript_106635/m.340265 type:complete len:594 (-) Transcript_106635:549-2330(-)
MDWTRWRWRFCCAALIAACFVTISTPWDWGSGFSSVTFIIWAVTLVLAATLLMLLRASRDVFCAVATIVAMAIVVTLLYSFRAAARNSNLGNVLGEVSDRHWIADKLTVMQNLLWPCACLQLDYILVQRASVLARTFGWSRTKRCLPMVWCLEALIGPTLLPYLATPWLREGPQKIAICQVVLFGAMVMGFGHLAICLMSVPLFWSPVRSLRAAARSPWGRSLLAQRPELLRAANRQMFALAANAPCQVVEVVTVILLFSRRATLEGKLIYMFSVALDSLTNIILVILLSGALRRETDDDKAAQEAGLRCAEKQRRSAAAYEVCADVGWQGAVETLAHRGFTLDKLLAFYKRLPELMPHFSPDVHTTNDVVRQAIIPESADQKCSMALKMMDGKTVRPQKMVTHNWSNLFRDLVACIVSDALNESTFGLVADLLDFDMPALERMLDAKALKKSYWVCAFSVNQHQSICAHNPARTVDPKTGVEHPVCSCGATVYFNNTPPLRESDSKSIHCQMNKFDDMMSFLSAADPIFSQVIAVDRAFGLFNRAWHPAAHSHARVLGRARCCRQHGHATALEVGEPRGHARRGRHEALEGS